MKLERVQNVDHKKAINGNQIIKLAQKRDRKKIANTTGGTVHLG